MSMSIATVIVGKAGRPAGQQGTGKAQRHLAGLFARWPHNGLRRTHAPPKHTRNARREGSPNLGGQPQGEQVILPRKSAAFKRITTVLVTSAILAGSMCEAGVHLEGEVTRTVYSRDGMTIEKEFPFTFEIDVGTNGWRIQTVPIPQGRFGPVRWDTWCTGTNVVQCRVMPDPPEDFVAKKGTNTLWYAKQSVRVLPHPYPGNGMDAAFALWLAYGAGHVLHDGSALIPDLLSARQEELLTPTPSLRATVQMWEGARGWCPKEITFKNAPDASKISATQNLLGLRAQLLVDKTRDVGSLRVAASGEFFEYAPQRQNAMPGVPVKLFKTIAVRFSVQNARAANDVALPTRIPVEPGTVADVRDFRIRTSSGKPVNYISDGHMLKPSDPEMAVAITNSEAVLRLIARHKAEVDRKASLRLAGWLLLGLIFLLPFAAILRGKRHT